MTPTMKLRFVERRIAVPVKAYNAYGDEGTISELKTVRVLQQWWYPDVGERLPEYRAYGEWRDVPLETEE